MPCSSTQNVHCEPSRGLRHGSQNQLTFTLNLGVTFGEALSALEFDEWFYKAALADTLHVDFRDVRVVAIHVESVDDTS